MSNMLLLNSLFSKLHNLRCEKLIFIIINSNSIIYKLIIYIIYTKLNK
jgi:hypothetical protein